MNQPIQHADHTNSQPRLTLRARAGAAGKALLVYLGSGSLVLAIIAYLVFNSMGC